MIKGIYFDFDGTLAWRMQAAYDNYRYILSILFPEMDPSSIEFEARVQKCLLWDQYGTVGKQYVMEQIQKKWKPDLFIEEGIRLWYSRFPEFQVWMEGAKETILGLKQDFRVGILSNGPHDRQWPKIRALGMDQIFDPVLVSEDLGVRKPDPQIYMIAAERMHLPIQEIVMIGDTFETDILGAVRAGMPAVWFSREHQAPTVYDIPVMHDYPSLRAWLYRHRYE
jgi:putative hydrolase of the HAD superfamily